MNSVIVKYLGLTDYSTVMAQMKEFTTQRDENSLDEIWLTEHYPVFTQGQAGKPEHVLMPGDIPIVQSDRGGQVTYHGPGQLIGYVLFSLQRLELTVHSLVRGIENSMVNVLHKYDVDAQLRKDAPGVYVAGNKIGALGLRIKRGYSYHGLSLNVAMNLEPFSRINACGLIGVGVCQLTDLAVNVQLDRVQGQLLQALLSTYQLQVVEAVKYQHKADSLPLG